jgi:hypothetical protein
MHMAQRLPAACPGNGVACRRRWRGARLHRVRFWRAYRVPAVNCGQCARLLRVASERDSWQRARCTMAERRRSVRAAEAGAMRGVSWANGRVASGGPRCDCLRLGMLCDVCSVRTRRVRGAHVRRGPGAPICRERGYLVGYGEGGARKYIRYCNHTARARPPGPRGGAAGSLGPAPPPPARGPPARSVRSHGRTPFSRQIIVHTT